MLRCEMRDSNDEIAIARCNSYAPNEVEGAVRKCLRELGGLQNYVTPGWVLVKPNLLSRNRPSGASIPIQKWYGQFYGNYSPWGQTASRR